MSENKGGDNGSTSSSMALADAMPQIVWTANPDGWLDYYNDQWVAYTGMTVAQSQGWGWAPVLHPDDLQHCVDVWKHCVDTGDSYEIEYRFRRASDGSYRWHLGRALPVRDSSGQIIKWFGTCTDIQDHKDAVDATERKVVERTLALADANERLQAEVNERRALSERLQADTVRLNQLIDAQTELAKPGLALEDFFALVISRLDLLTGAAGVALELIDDQDLVCHAASGAAAGHIGSRARADSSFSGLSLTTGEVLHARDTESDCRVNLDFCRLLGVRSILVAPLFVSDEAIGVIQIMASEVDVFIERDLQTLQLMAGLLGAAIARQNASEANQNLLNALAVAAQESRLREERTSALIAGANHSFISMDDCGLITEWNKNSEAIFGWSRAEAIGQSMAELIIPQRLRTAHHDGMRRYVSSGSAIAVNRRVELHGMHRDGHEFPVELTINSLKTGERMEYFAFLHDITARHQADAEIRKLNAELDQRVVERTAQLEAANRELEAFSYSVSHDLRAPLRGVDSFSRMVIEDYGPKLDDEGRRMLNVVRSEAQRMGELIDDLLTFSQVGRAELRKQSIDMTNLAVNVIEKMRLSPESHQQINVMALPQANGDRNLLQQVWVNLISNAVKFSCQQQTPSIEIGGSTENGVASYYIKDNGAGFDPRYIHKLFGVFQRLHTEEQFEGTGVGLALVQRIVHRHGGTVSAEGEVDKGATFTFSLPVLEEEAT